MREIVMCIMLGSLFSTLILQIAANIQLCFGEDDEDEQEFINELRCRNGNLNIILAVSAPIKIK